jgi:hypothetical protein
MQKAIMYVFVTIGGVVGAYIPSQFGADGFSFWAIIGSMIGGIARFWATYKIFQNI